MLRTWYFRWVVAAMILWVGALAVGLAALAGGSAPDRRTAIPARMKAAGPSTGGPASPGQHALRRYNHRSAE
jgi:hypothetical protein